MHIICKPAQILVLLPAQKKMREKNFHAEKNAHTEEKCARRDKYMIIEYVPTKIFKPPWLSDRIAACHAIDSGSSPVRCNLLSAHEKCANYYQRIAEKNAHEDKNAHTEENAHAEKCMIFEYVPTKNFKHWWFSGKIVACKAIDLVSIPRRWHLLPAHEMRKLLSENIREKRA